MTRRIVLFCLFLTAIVFAQDAPSANPIPRLGDSTMAKKVFTFEDMMQLKRIGDFTVSPDGKWVTFSATDVSLADNTKKTHLWIVSTDEGGSKRLTSASGPGEDRLRFSPDGKRVLFTSDRDGASQIWIQGFDSSSGTLTGQPVKATNISTEADGAIWSPDGKSILFVSAVYPDCRDDACNKQRDEEVSKSKVKAKVFNHLLYRHWNVYGNGKRSHLFLVASDCDATGANVACAGRDLTPGDHDVPPFSLGGQDQYQFSPDGREIAFTSNLDEVEATSTNSDVFVLSLADGAKPKNLTESNKGSDSTPMYSPDGKWIAIRSQFRAGYESDRFRLQLVDRGNLKQLDVAGCEQTDKKTGVTGPCKNPKYITNLTEGFDAWVDSMAWAPDSKSLYITAGKEGESPIYQLMIDPAAAPRAIVAHYTNDGPIPTADGKSLIFARNSIAYPTELFKVSLPITDQKNDAARNLTHLNDAVLGAIQMSSIEPFWFTGSIKHKVQGFIVKPPNFDSSKKYPVKFLIHGGPQGAWGDDWSFRWNPELFAASGYVVVMINPRGSTGYGQQFVDDVNGDWGGRPYQDLMMGLDYVEKTYSFIDKDRECALGASYGGYMVNWILGNTTRFKCIVSHDGMFNPESAFGTTEELWFNTWEFKGTPWNNRELYRKWSPALRATKFKTPTLVVHGQLDYRLDVSEGFQLFTTLQLQKVPSKMLYFPDEGHWVLKPQNSQLWYKTVTEWVDQWTKQEAK